MKFTFPSDPHNKPLAFSELLIFGPAVKGKETVCEEDEDAREILPFTLSKATRLYADASSDRIRVTVTQVYMDLTVDLQWRSVYEMIKAWTTYKHV